ncbi:flagellar hook-associated protein FlgK [Lysinibacillus sp. LZ02]|uniref:flagellar hook-associated protein FlgK n=1 Tax=Lysinibacillus sp. LZ02 TaxID=3420668 RepID=UPI003D365206
MRSTFMGLEASKRGLFVQQSALYTTGHNISNANTLGYSRQRVNMQATPGYPYPGLNSPTYPGHLGTGVEAGSIQRIRDQFIDRQYRQETNKLGYWESTTQSISQMEDIMTEPSEFGINQAFTDFWKSMEDVIDNPKDTAGRQVMISKGQALAEAFNYMDTQLKLIQGNIGNEINVSTEKVNSILKQIAAINKQILAVEPNGYVPNDLYDARDLLVDELNEYIPVSISMVESGGLAKDVAEGSMTIKFKPFEGGPEITLVDGKNYATLATTDTNGAPIDGDVDDQTTNGFAEFGAINVSDLGDPPADALTNAVATIDYNTLEPSKGKLLSLVDAYGHSGGEGLYPEMLKKLDVLVNDFITAFNEQHKKGFDLDGAPGVDFFSGTSARDIKVEITDPKQIAASGAAGEEGNNENIRLLAQLHSDTRPNLQNGTFQTYYKSLTGELAVKGQEAIRNAYNSGTLHLQIANSRASMSSVSLDEEMTNMITFQQAYNANARMITVVDEILEKIINGMGRVGL